MKCIYSYVRTYDTHSAASVRPYRIENNEKKYAVTESGLTSLTSHHITATLHRLTDQRLSVTDAVMDTDYPTFITTYTTDDLRSNGPYNSEPGMETLPRQPQHLV